MTSMRPPGARLRREQRSTARRPTCPTASASTASATRRARIGISPRRSPPAQCRGEACLALVWPEAPALCRGEACLALRGSEQRTVEEELRHRGADVAGGG